MAHTRAGRIKHTILVRGGVVVVGAVADVIISRSLGPSGRGAYAVLLSVATIALAVGHLSLDHAQTYHWSKVELRRALEANAVATGAVLGSLVAVATWLGVDALGRRALHIENGAYLAIAVAALPAATVTIYLSNTLTLDERITRVNLAQALAAALEGCGVGILAILHHLDLMTAIIIWTGAFYLSAAVVLVSVRVQPKACSLGLARRTVRLGLRYHLGVVFLFLLYRVDILILDTRVSQYQVGLYSLAVALAEATYLGTIAIAQVMLPFQASAALDAAAETTVRTMRINALVALASWVLLAAACPWLIPLVYGGAFRHAYAALVVLGPGIVATGTVRSAGGYLIRLNRPSRLASLTGAAMLLNVALNFALIPELGIIGSSLASSIAYAALAVAYVVWIARAADLPLLDFLPRLADVRALLVAVVPGAATRQTT